MGAASPGALLETRVARLLHAEGAFVRTSVDLNAQFHGGFGITDLDVLAVSFDPTLVTRVVNGECKTSESKSAPSGGDRLLWLAGVAQLLQADARFLVTIKGASDEARALARRLGSEILDKRDLERREQMVRIDERTPYGVHSAEALALRASVQRTTRGDRELQRLYFFVRSELWLATPTAALKRAIAACRVLSGRYAASLPDAERIAVRWLAGEVVTGFSLALTRIAGQAYRVPEDIFVAQFNEALAEGIASYEALRETSKAVDRYLVGVLRRLGVEPSRTIDVIGAFEPRPPSYAEPLIELVQRIALSARAAVDLARLAEHYTLGVLAPSVWQAAVPAQNEEETARLLRNVAAFLEGQTHLPAELLRPLREGLRTPTDAAAAQDTGASRDLPSAGPAKPQRELFATGPKD